ncbi:MAG: isoleucine--tRNA ligase [Elusimicrobiota bacterium]
MAEDKKVNKYPVNLPETKFSMKANLPVREPQFLEYWESIGLYQKMLEHNTGGKKFVLHDGPPYANGPIHLGHALNKILKDMVVKYKSLCGYHTPYIPGWDCHGLPIEQNLMKEKKIDKRSIDRVKFRKDAEVYAQKYIDLQRNDFKRLGITADWENPYITMSPKYEGGIYRSFRNLVKNGYIYRRKKPVYWCVQCETALADSEIEFQDHGSPSVYVKFPVINEGVGSKVQPVAAVLIWTTTPWTLPANVALAFNPEFDYVNVALKLNDGRNENLIVSEYLLPKIAEVLHAGNIEVLQKYKGKDLEGIKCIHPVIEGKISVGVLAGYVSLEDGTGIVHIAPGHGDDDYEVGLKYNLPIFAPVNAYGKFTNEVPKYEGQKVFEANANIIADLTQQNVMLHNSEANHSYPHCWRCKKPVIFRATEQWFLNVDYQGLREKLLAETDRVHWIPDYGLNRIKGMVSSRPDWCLSRQRFWGAPIPVMYCQKCNTPLMDDKVLENIEKLITQYGTNVWYEKDVGELLPQGIKCACGHNEFKKGEDIIDVWFDSGVSHESVLRTDANLTFPADVYLEGSDQHRGWFQTSLIPAVALHNTAPYKAVITHGFVLDGNGRAMHKSLGNVIAPQEIIKKYGAEILRLWVANSDYHEDIRISEEILKQLADTYRKIRNTYRFMLGNLCDYNPEDNCVKCSDLWDIDKYMLHKLYMLVTEVTRYYEAYEFNKVLRAVHDYCVFDLSNFYLDILKDRLYTFGPGCVERRGAQTVMYQTLMVLVKSMSPMLSFTAEDVWQTLKVEKAGAGLEESVFLSGFATAQPEWLNKPLAAKWEVIRKIKEKVNLEMEKMRQEKVIGSSLEAKVEITSFSDEEFCVIKEYEHQWPMITISSSVVIFRGKGEGDVMIKISKADGIKCVRCWNYSHSVSKHEDHPELCDRCHEVVRGCK